MKINFKTIPVLIYCNDSIIHLGIIKKVNSPFGSLPLKQQSSSKPKDDDCYKNLFNLQHWTLEASALSSHHLAGLFSGQLDNSIIIIVININNNNDCYKHQCDHYWQPERTVRRIGSSIATTDWPLALIIILIIMIDRYTRIKIKKQFIEMILKSAVWIGTNAKQKCK